MGGNYTETLLPVTNTAKRGVGGTETGASYFAQMYDFLFFTLNSLSIVVIWGKLLLVVEKIPCSFCISNPKENGDFALQLF